MAHAQSDFGYRIGLPNWGDISLTNENELTRHIGKEKEGFFSVLGFALSVRCNRFLCAFFLKEAWRGVTSNKGCFVVLYFWRNLFQKETSHFFLKLVFKEVSSGSDRFFGKYCCSWSIPTSYLYLLLFQKTVELLSTSSYLSWSSVMFEFLVSLMWQNFRVKISFFEKFGFCKVLSIQIYRKYPPLLKKNENLQKVSWSFSNASNSSTLQEVSSMYNKLLLLAT